jgi:hypothetical protein
MVNSFFLSFFAKVIKFFALLLFFAKNRDFFTFSVVRGQKIAFLKKKFFAENIYVMYLLHIKF